MAMLAIQGSDFWSALLTVANKRPPESRNYFPQVAASSNLGEASALSVICPTCGYRALILVDTFAGDQTFMEDCTVCCRAIELRVKVREYEVQAVTVERPY
jgi:hypothetical protein